MENGELKLNVTSPLIKILKKTPKDLSSQPSKTPFRKHIVITKVNQLL